MKLTLESVGLMPKYLLRLTHNSTIKSGLKATPVYRVASFLPSSGWFSRVEWEVTVVPHVLACTLFTSSASRLEQGSYVFSPVNQQEASKYVGRIKLNLVS